MKTEENFPKLSTGDSFYLIAGAFTGDGKLGTVDALTIMTIYDDCM